MKGHRIALLIGAVWVLVRLALVLTIARGALGGGMMANINFLWIGGTTIVIAVIFATAVYRPTLHTVFVPLLRISMILMVLSDIVVILSGSYVDRAVTATNGDARDSPDFAVAFGVLVVDLLITAALISYRPVQPESEKPADTHLPPYETTDVGGK